MTKSTELQDYLVVTAFVTVAASSILGLSMIPLVGLLGGFLVGTIGTNIFYRYFHNKWSRLDFTKYPKWKVIMWQCIIAAVLCNFGWNSLLMTM